MVHLREPLQAVAFDLFEDQPEQRFSSSRKEAETIGANERVKEEISDVEVLAEYLKLQRARFRNLAGLPPVDTLNKEGERTQAQKREREEQGCRKEVKRIARKMQELSGRRGTIKNRQKLMEETVNKNMQKPKNRNKTLKDLTKRDEKKPMTREDINMYIKRRKLQALK